MEQKTTTDPAEADSRVYSHYRILNLEQTIIVDPAEIDYIVCLPFIIRHLEQKTIAVTAEVDPLVYPHFNIRRFSGMWLSIFNTGSKLTLRRLYGARKKKHFSVVFYFC